MEKLKEKPIKKEFITCISCSKSKEKNTNYYNTSNKIYANTKKIPLCKTCIKNMVDYDDMETVYSILRQFDIMFDIECWESAVESKMDTIGRYMSMANSLSQFRETGWKDSIFKSTNENLSIDIKNKNDNKRNIEVIENESPVVINNRDRDDVIRMLGFDPFEHENPRDRNQLYNRLIDFLDESALEDGFKLQASIEIVIGFNQVDKINQAITNITNDLDKLALNSGGIKSLIDSKKNILASLIKLAEENGISVKHNNQKSKGAGTLTGIIKTLQEKGIEEGELNLFDIETAQGMRQVADISNESIVKQLQFDENDYTNMILEQREIIQKLDDKVVKLEEENRLIKRELLKYNKTESELNES